MSNKSSNVADIDPSSEDITPEYLKPHILLMNISHDISEYLREKKLDVAEGSFGEPYKVPVGRNHPVFFNGKIPEHYAEKEIVIIDLSVGEPQDINNMWMTIKKGDGGDLTAFAVTDVIDPRPVVMAQLQEDFQRIYKHGGIFIIFASRKNAIDCTLTGSWTEVNASGIVPNNLNTWTFLPMFANMGLEVTYDVGKEILPPEESNELVHIFQQYAPNARYECTLEPSGYLGQRWISIATNKYHNSVAGIIVPSNDALGTIFIFPQVKQKSQLLEQLLFDFLPNKVPALFPYFQGSKWINRPEYELAAVKSIRLDIQQIRDESAKKIEQLETEMTKKSAESQYLWELLTGTGDNLRDAVHHAFRVIGFSNVEIMDEGLTRADTKREDLQVRDDSRLLLVEVKGLGSIPKDSASLAVLKYMLYHTRHNKDFDRNAIYGISIINHQKGIPLFERKYNPFSEEILASAIESNFGLLTTWNLHKLVRSFIKLNWSHEVIKDLFYQSDFIEPVPKHYEYIGVVEEFWERHSAVGVRLESGNLSKGDRIAFELPIEFEEQNVDSLQVDNIPVDQAEIGSLAGVSTPFVKNQLKVGRRVFQVK